MTVLGISLGFNSSASLWKNGKCLASLSQERITGNKNTKEIPFAAAAKCFDVSGCKDDEVFLAYSHYEKLSFAYIDKNKSLTLPVEYGETPEHYLIACFSKFLDKKIIGIERVEHHDAHKWACYAVYGIEDKPHTVLTMDGFGDGVSARLTVSDVITAEMPLVKSPALYYQFVTGALGFKEHQHEGKVTGLATSAEYDCDENLASDMYDYMLGLWNGKIELSELSESEEAQVKESTIFDFDMFLRLKKTIYAKVQTTLPIGYNSKKVTSCKEAIAWAQAVQQFTENIVMNFLVENRGRITDTIYLSGGLFANVALNRLFGKDYSNVYICPAMGDEGTAMGAAAYAMFRDSFDNGFHPEYIIDAGIHMAKLRVDTVVDEISKATVVHICTGRSEFGPRALMHRSTLFSAVDENTSEALNKAMGRSEFMPYAPVCRAEDVDKLFIGWEPFEKSLHFMTVALGVKNHTLITYSPAVHSDGTCRVQVLHKDVECEKQAYELLDKYCNATGEEMLINTSFNIHNEPTCCTYKQCKNAWERSKNIGTLFIGGEKRCLI